MTWRQAFQKINDDLKLWDELCGDHPVTGPYARHYVQAAEQVNARNVPVQIGAVSTCLQSRSEILLGEQVSEEHVLNVLSNCPYWYRGPDK